MSKNYPNPTASPATAEFEVKQCQDELAAALEVVKHRRAALKEAKQVAVRAGARYMAECRQADAESRLFEARRSANVAANKGRK